MAQAKSLKVEQCCRQRREHENIKIEAAIDEESHVTFRIWALIDRTRSPVIIEPAFCPWCGRRLIAYDPAAPGLEYHPEQGGAVREVRR